MSDRNPQREQMAHESMVRNLASQAEAIWPQERSFVAGYSLPPRPDVLDVGCGTGEITRRVAELLPAAKVLGVDLEDPHLERARASSAALGTRVSYRRSDAYQLDIPDRSYDLVLCRHMLQAVPQPEQVVAELARVTRPGGWLHLVAEDYSMMHFHPTALDADDFWRRGPITLAERTGTDLRSGRKMFSVVAGLGLENIQVRYVVIDTLRVPRRVFADIWRAWRDGYAELIANHSDLSLEQVLAHWNDMLAAIENPQGYAVWQLPVISARRPGGERLPGAGDHPAGP